MTGQKGKIRMKKTESSQKPVVSRGKGRLLNSEFWLLATKSKPFIFEF